MIEEESDTKFAAANNNQVANLKFKMKRVDLSEKFDISHFKGQMVQTQSLISLEGDSERAGQIKQEEVSVDDISLQESLKKKPAVPHQTDVLETLSSYDF